MSIAWLGSEPLNEEPTPKASSRLRSRLALGTVARSMVIVGGATAIGQGAIVLASPLLSRLYTPDAFGLLGVYVAVLSILTGLASLRFDFAIPIATNAGAALHLLGLSVALALLVSAATGFAVLLWGTQLAAALGASAIEPFLWLLPAALLVASVAQALSGWAVYHRSFPSLGRMRATQGIAQALGQTALGFLQAGPIGLLVGDLAGRSVGMGQLLRSLFATMRSTTLSRAAMLRGARDQWGFARVMVVASLLSTLSLQVPFLLIPAFFDLEATGQYFLAYRVLVLPASLVGAAVSQVFFGEASHRRGSTMGIHDLTLNVTISLFVFAVPTYGIIAVSGSTLFETVFGPPWRTAGLYAQIMAPWLILWSVASPISSLLLVGRRERESLAFTAAELGVRAGALGIGAMAHSLTIGIAALTVTSILLNVSALWRFLRVASITLGDLIRPAMRILGLTAPAIGVILVVAQILPALLLPAALIGWVISVTLAVRFSPEARALLRDAHG